MLQAFSNMDNFLKFILLFTVWTVGIDGIEMGSSDNSHNEGSNGGFFSLMSVAVLCTVVLLTVEWAWWRRTLCFWSKHGTHDALCLPTDTRPNSSVITIEPLASLDKFDSQHCFELRTFRAPGIIPTTVGPSQGSSQVWFQAPHKGFPRQNVEYLKLIGQGWFGKVWQAEAKGIKQFVSVSNVITRELRMDSTDEEQKQFLHEARIFQEAHQYHVEGSGVGAENILKLIGFCIEQMPFTLIFEYYPLGDLKTYLKTRAKQPPIRILSRMIIDIIRGVKWMTHAGFAHGDLAARNCLVADSAGKVMIGDYGFSTQKHRADYFWSSNRAIPIRWAAPETLSFDDDLSLVQCYDVLNHEANIWSLGVVIWEVFQLGKLPYDTLMDEEVIRRVITQGGYILEPPQLPFVNQNTKEKIYHLLVSCWNSTPSLRPSIEAIEEVFITPNIVSLILQ